LFCVRWCFEYIYLISDANDYIQYYIYIYYVQSSGHKTLRNNVRAPRLRARFP